MLSMVPRCLLFILHISSSLCQYMMDTNMRADMTFDDVNDRFDVGNIIAEQNRIYKEQPLQNDFDYRRIGRDQIPLVEFIKSNRLSMKQKIQRDPKRRMNMADFAYHDQMLSEPEDDDGAYERNLLKFKTQNARRNLHIVDIAKLKTGFNDIRNRIANSNKKKHIANKINFHEAVLKYLHGNNDMKKLKGGRRRQEVDPDNEILLHYAVPINLKVNGYLEVPEVL